MHIKPATSIEDHLAHFQRQNVSWDMRGTWLLQIGNVACSPLQNLCRPETIHALLLLIGLCATIVTIVFFFVFSRTEKEEHITPLCPQLVVKEAELHFKAPLDSQAEKTSVLDLSNDSPFCKFAVDMPLARRQNASGVVATVRLQSNLDITLATVVARSSAAVGHGLALCRAGFEIFGFVDPDGPRRYSVRHRTGVLLLTLVGDFDAIDIEVVNPMGSTVCWLKKLDGDLRGCALQHVDLGLVLCSFLAVHVHRRIASTADLQTAEEAIAKEAAGQEHHWQALGAEPRAPAG